MSLLTLTFIQVSFDIMSLYTEVSFDTRRSPIAHVLQCSAHLMLQCSAQWHEVTYTEVHTSIYEIDMWERHISVHLSDTSVRYFALLYWDVPLSHVYLIYRCIDISYIDASIYEIDMWEMHISDVQRTSVYVTSCIFTHRNMCTTLHFEYIPPICHIYHIYNIYA